VSEGSEGSLAGSAGLKVVRVVGGNHGAGRMVLVVVNRKGMVGVGAAAVVVVVVVEGCFICSSDSRCQHWWRHH
jgi:hypothetical protein